MATAKGYEENDERGLYRIVHRHGHLPGGIVTVLAGYLRQLPFIIVERVARALSLTRQMAYLPQRVEIDAMALYTLKSRKEKCQSSSYYLSKCNHRNFSVTVTSNIL